jgi:hypothetical protein
MEPLKPQSINYKKIEQVSGKYRFNRVSMNNSTGANVPLTTNTSTVIEFKLPAGVYNLARSFISFVNNVAAVTANTILFDNTLSIAQSIQFGTSGGLNLCDIQYANNYINVVRPIDTPVDVFLSNDATTGLYPITPSNAISAYSNNIFPQSFAVNATNPYNMVTTTQLLNPIPNGICDARQSVAAGASVVNTSVFPLSGVTNTILSMDKDQYFPDNMYLRISTAYSGKVAYQGVVGMNDGNTTPAVISVQPVLNNVCLYLAMEKDQLIIDSLMSKYASGNLKYQIPYVIAYRNTVAIGTSTIQLQLNSGNGKKLKRVVTTFFNANETGGALFSNLAYDHSNVNARLCSSYQTYVDNMPLQDSVLSCSLPTALLTNMDDWRENKQTCRGSAIKNSLEYSQHWFHADRFYEKNETTDIQSDNIDEGLSLAIPKAWSIQANMTAAAVNYTFCNVIRDLSISSAGILFI